MAAPGPTTARSTWRSSPPGRSEARARAPTPSSCSPPATRRASAASVTAKVTIGTVGQGYGLAVELEASLPEMPRDKAEALVAAAHQVCPYSNATRGNIVVDVKLAGA